MKRIIILIWALVLCVPVFGEGYAIKLSRPVVAGAKYRLVSRSNEERKEKFGDDSKDRPRIFLEMEANVEVLSVDKNGDPTKERFVVQKCVRKVNEAETVVVPKDSVFFSTVENGRRNISVERGELSRESRQALSDLTSSNTSKVNDDDVFGTKEKKNVGDSWPMNVDVALTDLPEGLDATRENMSGETTLVAVTNVAGVKCLEFAARVEMKELKLPVPPGAKLSAASGKMAFRKIVPADPSGRIVTESGSMGMSMHGTISRNGEEQTFVREKVRNFERSFFWK